LNSLSVEVEQWSSARKSAASERKWLTILLVWVQRSGVGTRELWVNDSILPSENMEYGPGVPDTHAEYPTIDDFYRVVHMEGCNFSGTNIDSTEAEETTSLGINWYHGRDLLIGRMWAQNLKKSSATATPTPAVEPGWTQGESPSHRTDTDDVRLSISVRAWHGLRSTRGNDETLPTFKLRLYHTLHSIAAAKKGYREMRIKQQMWIHNGYRCGKYYIRPGYGRKSHPCCNLCYII